MAGWLGQPDWLAGTDLEVEDGEETDREQDGGEERVEHLGMDLTVWEAQYWILDSN